MGPVDAVAGEAVGPAGPTTATRMDKFVEPLLAPTGLLAMIGKAERGPAAMASIRRHGAAYLAATGGAAHLLSQAIRTARVVAFADLGMEALHEFTPQDFPVTVAVDSAGRSIHRFAPGDEPRLASRAASPSHHEEPMRAVTLQLRHQAELPVKVGLHRSRRVVRAFIGATVAVGARRGEPGVA